MIYDPKVTTQPAEEPITLVEAKLNLRVDSSADDDLITNLIVAARQWCEKYQNRSYVTQTVTLKMDEFPDCGDFSEIVVPNPPLQSVTSIKYIDDDGDEQTLDSSVYSVDTYSEPGRIGLAYNQSWPSIRGDMNAVEVVYVAGYGDADDVPDRIKQAMHLIIAHLYEHREQNYEKTLMEPPMNAKSLLHLDRLDIV